MKNTGIALLLLVLISACGERNGKSGMTLQADSSLGTLVADTIIYDVALTNPNPEDPWGDQRLKRLNRKAFVDSIFLMIYSGNATAYDHNTGEKLTVKQMERMEIDSVFQRTKINMIQFKEAWYINPSGISITKDVISMVLGSQVYDSYGVYLGNRAVMRVELRK